MTVLAVKSGSVFVVKLVLEHGGSITDQDRVSI